MALMATGVINMKSKEKTVAPAPRPRPLPAARRPSRSRPPRPPASLRLPRSPPRHGVIRFSGHFTEKENTRKVELLCPSCGKPIDAGIPKCPSCNAAVKWPEKVKCGFCFSDKPGACGVCNGTGNCPVCSKGRGCSWASGLPATPARARQVPGLRRQRLCGYCEEGWYFPGRLRRSGRSRSSRRPLRPSGNPCPAAPPSKTE